MECGHVRDDDLSRTVHLLPCGKNEIGVFILNFPRLVALLVLRFRCDPQIAECLVDQAVRETVVSISANERRNPAIAV